MNTKWNTGPSAAELTAVPTTDGRIGTLVKPLLKPLFPVCHSLCTAITAKDIMDQELKIARMSTWENIEELTEGGSLLTCHHPTTLDYENVAHLRSIDQADMVIYEFQTIRRSVTSHHPHPTDVTDTIDAGVASLQEHRQYIDGLGESAPDPDSMLRGFAAMMGERFGGRLAVTFELLG